MNTLEELYQLYHTEYRSNYGDEDREKVAFIHGMIAVLNKLQIDITQLGIEEEIGDDVRTTAFTDAVKEVLSPYEVH